MKIWGSIGCLVVVGICSWLSGCRGTHVSDLDSDRHAAQAHGESQTHVAVSTLGTEAANVESSGQSNEAAWAVDSPKLDELLLFFPARYPAGDWNPSGLDFEDVWFHAEDGTKLHGWYCACEKPKAVVLFAHGNAGHLAHRADRIRHMVQEFQVSVLIFDYRGYGRSEGKPSVRGAIEDTKAAREYLCSRLGIQHQDIVLVGRSLGGALVTQLAAESSARALILESTFSSLREVAAVHYSRLAWVVPLKKLNSVMAIEKYEGPLLQCHGNRDQTIPIELAEKLHATATGPKEWVVIEGGDHNDAHSDRYHEVFARFIDSLAKNDKAKID